MRIVVLLSAGLHPASGQPALPKVEAQAIRLALGLGDARGLHAGPSAAPASDALGHGLTRLTHLATPAGADVVPGLVAALGRDRPDLILAGRRGQGGDDTGLAPYAIAAGLGIAMVGDAVSVETGEEGTIVVEQALPKGTRRRLIVRLPAVVAVHPSAPGASAFAFGVARRGAIDTIKAATVDVLTETPDERPYRRRPKLLRSAPTGSSASERLSMATGTDRSDRANVIVNPSPREAAEAIILYLRKAQILKKYR